MFLFVLTTNVLEVVLFAVKFAFGLIYAYRCHRPYKIEYDFLHKGNLGHHLWRVQRAKYMRNLVVNYFIASSVTTVFSFGQNLLLDSAFMLVASNPYIVTHMIIDLLFGFYGCVYALRKIKAHMKEWDRLVTIRFNET